MSDQWMLPLRFPLSRDLFALLPRNPAYKYEYLDGQAVLSPRPRYYHALLDLESAELPYPSEMPVRPLREDDWHALPLLFQSAFARHLPFATVPESERLATAEAALATTRSGGDGPLILPACFVAAQGATIFGAILITLLPPGDPEEFSTYAWGGPLPDDALQRAEGWPHLTWIFVDGWQTGQGIGTALLAAAVAALRQLGYNDLLSTFLLGNEISAMWHWRCGFRLLSYPGSFRRRVPPSDAADGR
ncbi:MAG: GNAT family N-acetyltransferase [Gemmataceae bacterium]